MSRVHTIVVGLFRRATLRRSLSMARDNLFRRRLFSRYAMGVMVRDASSAELLADVSETVVDQVTDKGVRRAIVRETSFIARRHESHPPQKRQLVARCREGEPEGSRNVSDRQLFVRQGMHQREPHRIGEQLEDFDRFSEHVWSRQAFSRCRDLFCTDDFG